VEILDFPDTRAVALGSQEIFQLTIILAGAKIEPRPENHRVNHGAIEKTVSHGGIPPEVPHQDRDRFLPPVPQDVQEDVRRRAVQLEG